MYAAVLQDSYTFEIVQFNAKNDRVTAPSSGLVRSSRDNGRIMQNLRDTTFTRFDTSLMP